MDIKNYLIKNNLDDLEISKIVDIFENQNVKKYFEKLKKIDAIFEIFLNKFGFLAIAFFIIYVISKEKVYNFNGFVIDLNYLILFFWGFVGISLSLKFLKFIFKNIDTENEIYRNLLKIFSKNSDFSDITKYFFQVGELKQNYFKNTFFIETDFGKIFFQDNFSARKHFVRVEFFDVKKLEKIEQKGLSFMDYLKDEFLSKSMEKIEIDKFDLHYENKILDLAFNRNLIKNSYEIKDYLDFYIFVKKILSLISDFEKNIK